VIAVEGNFDDAQAGVKRIFSDPRANTVFDKSNRALSSANSINFGRLAPQIAYYFSAYVDLCASCCISMGDELNFCVPTGNFGNILAAYYAKAMGLPVGMLICASNKNNVLAEFIGSGIYNSKRYFHNTIAPSMDILISSNLERMLFELCERDAGAVAGWMDELKREGSYKIDALSYARLCGHMWGGWENEAETVLEIRRCWYEQKYLLDPHTATASAVLGKYRVMTGDTRPCVIAATASPYKFASAVSGAVLETTPAGEFALCEMIAEHTGLPVPAAIAELASLPVKHTARCKPEDMLDTLIDILEVAR
jgi:threonine synthase